MTEYSNTHKLWAVKRVWLRDARKRKKLTQEELARRIGKQQSDISKLESGFATDPPVSVLKDLARELDVDPMALRFGTHEEASR